VWDYVYGDEERFGGPPAHIITPVWTTPHSRYKDLVWARKVITLYNAGVRYGHIPHYPPPPKPTRSRNRVESTSVDKPSSKGDSVLRVSKGERKGRLKGAVKVRGRESK